MNYKTERYAYLCDRTGELNYTTQNADVSAIQLWKDHTRTLDDPASVLYAKSMGGDRVDLQAQGTGLYQVIGHYASVAKVGDNQYYVFATQSGISKYLGDSRTNLVRPEGVPSFNATGDYRKWSLFPVNETDNYLGITPKFTAGGKYYAYYYVSFPFRKVSSGLKVYYVSKIDAAKSLAVMQEITSDIIPAATPVIVECPSATADGNKIMPVTGGGAAPSGNLLGGVYFCSDDRPNSPYTATPFNTSTMRALGVLPNGKIGYISNPDYLQTASAKLVDYDNALPANSSYLKVPSGTPASLTLVTKEEYDAANKVNATSVSLSQTSATLHVGESVTLTATVLPANATDKTVTWKSSNTAVATVVDGKVTAVALGEATITATTADGSNLSATCVVKVEPIKVASVTLSQTSATLHVGDNVTLTATVLPATATDKTVTWKSSNTAVATVVDGKVTAVALGEATITATTADGTNLSASCVVKVEPIKAASVTLSQTSATLHVGENVTLTATVLPANATDKAVTWKSSNTAVATVVDGKVTAVALGEATIMATTADGSNLSASCAVKVEPIKAASVTLSQTSATLHVGEDVTLTATVQPANATDKAVTWKSSNTAVATVVDGKVTAVALGEATITATTADGSNLTATCVVKVEPIKAASVTLSQTSATLHVGEDVTLTATVLPDNATDKTVTWKSSNTAVATVVDGKVTAVALGEATITVRTADGSNLTATCVVKVEPVKVASITLSQTAATLYPADELQLTATVAPDNATDKSVTWSSNNTAVATVVDGKVVAVAPGDAVITVAATDGSNVTAQCAVKVQPILVTSITLSQTAVDATVGDRLQLTATVAPDNATDKSVTWSSSNTAVATVDAEGIVAVIGAGNAVITATTHDGSALTASCSITAVPVTVLATDVTLDLTTVELGIGRTQKVTATVLPEDASTRSVTWSSSNEAVATVNGVGVITAVAAGEAVITATTVDGTDLTATCTVTVTLVQVERITLAVTEASMKLNSTLQLTATAEPADATDKTLTWKSSDTSVATVDEQGLVTAKGVGTAVITVSTADGSMLTASCTVTVAPTLAESVSLNITDVDVEIGATLQLTATVLPEATTDKTVTWSSSDTEVATVNAQGLVTTVGVGEAVITATTADGSALKATCNVTVLPIRATSIALDKTEAVVPEGETLQLVATVLPDNATDKAVVWRSSDEQIATVDANGLVTAVARGNVVITATTADGSNLAANWAVTVTFPVGIRQVGDVEGSAQIYTPDGRRHSSLQRGINLVRMADGSVRRVIVK